MKSPIKVTFLGTGTSQGVPVIGSNHPVCKSTNFKDKRLRVSILLQWDNKNIVIDCGPDFRQQMLREEIDTLDAILLTHEHSDHIAGMDDIRPFYFKSGDVPFYAHNRVFRSLKKRFDYIFETKNKYPGTPTIKEHPISKEASFSLFGKNIIPIEAYHASLPVLGFRIDGFTYLTDVKTISEEELEKVIGTKVLVLNALRKESHYSHLNLKEAMHLVARIKPKEVYFTHISHVMGFHDEVEKSLPGNMHLAYDTLKLEI